MKALVFGALWLGLGCVVALRGARPPVERALALVFWPFFVLADGGEARPEHPAKADVSGLRGPLARLHAALGGSDAAGSVVLDLRQAVARLEDRLQRVEQALTELRQEPAGEGALAEARARSESLLTEARGRCKTELDAALAAVEETATRLVIARETGSDREVAQLLASLRGRLQAAEEVAGVEPDGPRLVAG